ncbi:hypothetical protein ACFXP7_00840 [Microbacterium sp. P06]|uniref:hypothetical protein n=1 Tax=unclassified Microbacterium TaxID=2609290 RepID=UPI003746B71A
MPMAGHLINRGEINAADINDIWEAWFDEPLGTVEDQRFARFITDLNALVRPSP